MRGAEGVEQQHALPGLAQVPGGPGAEHAGADDDGVPALLPCSLSAPRPARVLATPAASAVAMTPRRETFTDAHRRCRLLRGRAHRAIALAEGRLAIGSLPRASARRGTRPRSRNCARVQHLRVDLGHRRRRGRRAPSPASDRWWSCVPSACLSTISRGRFAGHGAGLGRAVLELQRHACRNPRRCARSA